MVTRPMALLPTKNGPSHRKWRLHLCRRGLNSFVSFLGDDVIDGKWDGRVIRLRHVTVLAGMVGALPHLDRKQFVHERQETFRFLRAFLAFECSKASRWLALT